MEGVVVVVIVINKEYQSVWYTKGQLSNEDIKVLKVMHHWTKKQRESYVKESPYLRETQVLQKIFRYNKDGFECGDVFEPVDNPTEHGPCHVVVFKN